MDNFYRPDVQRTVAESLAKIAENTPRSQAMKELFAELDANGIAHNVASQLLPTKEQRGTACEILLSYAQRDDLADNETVYVFACLVKLKLRKREVASLLIREIEKRADQDPPGYCWTLCDGLRALGVPDFREDYIRIAKCQKLGANRQPIFMLMGNKKEECYLPVILGALTDIDVNGHALSALAKYSDPDAEYDEYFRFFLTEPRAWVRRIAEKRLNGKI